MKRTLVCLFLIPNLIAASAHARLVESETGASPMYKVGVLFEKSANGQVKPVCEFSAIGLAPQHLQVASGPSKTPSLPVPSCNDHELKVVASTVEKTSSGMTAAPVAVIPAAMCITLAATVTYMTIKETRLNNTASFVLGASAMAVVSTLGMGPSGLAGATLCAMVGEGFGESIQFLIAYFKEPI